MEDLHLRIKTIIVTGMQLERVEPSDIATDEPLFGDDSRLDFDSVDALELVVEIERHFGVQLDDDDESRKVLYTVGSIAEWLAPRISQ